METEFNFTEDKEKEEGQGGSPPADASGAAEPGQDGEPPVQNGEAPPDPLESLTPQQILDHPKLGAQIRSWSDTAASKQIKQALDRAKADWQEDSQFEAMNQRFKDLQGDELADVLSDPDTKKAYLAWERRREEEAQGRTTEEIAKAGQVYGYGVQVQANMDLLNSEPFPDDVKAKLNPDNYKGTGGAGIEKWSADIQRALADLRANQTIQAQLEEKWEQYKEEHLAELEGRRPSADISSGRASGPLTPDKLRGLSLDEVRALPKAQRDVVLAQIGKSNGKQ